MTTLTVQTVRNLPMIRTANEWKSGTGEWRLYLNLKGNGRNFRGEQNTKIWLSLGGELTIEKGKGCVSEMWSQQLADLKAALAAMQQQQQ